MAEFFKKINHIAKEYFLVKKQQPQDDGGV